LKTNKNMTPEQQKALDNVMDWFDFEKVHRTMRFLRWNWASAEDGTPCIGEIREMARALLTRSIELGQGIGTGGFQVTYSPQNNYLKLEFIISEWETEI